MEPAKEMATGFEKSVFLVTLLLFCILGVCTGLTLELNRMGQDSNRITLTCSDTASVPVPSALFYMRAPGTDSRMLVDGNSGLVDFARNGGAITFTITPETEANFTCASSPARRDETSGLLLAGGKSSSEEYLVTIMFIILSFPCSTPRQQCSYSTSNSECFSRRNC